MSEGNDTKVRIPIDLDSMFTFVVAAKYGGSHGHIKKEIIRAIQNRIDEIVEELTNTTKPAFKEIMEKYYNTPEWDYWNTTCDSCEKRCRPEKTTNINKTKSDSKYKSIKPEKKELTLCPECT